MKGMALSGKPGMVQAMQIPPTLGHPPMPRIQPRLVTLQLTTGPQQPNFTMHFGGSVLEGEISLLVVAGAVATFVDGLSKKPGGAKLVVKRNYRGHSCRYVDQIQQRLRHVVRLHRTAGDIDNGKSATELKFQPR